MAIRGRRSAVITVIGTILAAGALALSGCAGTSGGSSDDQGGASSAESVVGTWGDKTKGSPWLTLADDETVTGSDGCNGIGSTFTVEDGVVTLAPFFSTQMACTGVDTWLSKIKSVSVEGDTMTVLNSAGDVIGTLPRASAD